MSEQKLLDALPEHFSKLIEMREIARVEGIQFDSLYAGIDDLLDQMYISTATWGLSYWEVQYKLPVLTGSKDYITRRQRVLTKKRSNKASLTDILRAIEPSIELAWGGAILPFTIESTADYYDFGELVRVLEIEKPSHLTYSFSIKPNGYTVRAEKRSRNEVALQLISGTAKSGRYPRRNARGESINKDIVIRKTQLTGIAKLQRSAGLVSGGKDTQTSFGVTEHKTINVEREIKVGIPEYVSSGGKKSGQIAQKTTGIVEVKAVVITSGVDSGKSEFRKSGQRCSNSVAGIESRKISVSKLIKSGVSSTFACGSRVSGEGVMA